MFYAHILSEYGDPHLYRRHRQFQYCHRGAEGRVLTAAKTAVRENYEPGGTVTYVVSLTNSGITPLTGLTISDNLGGYTFGGATLYPLAYLPGQRSVLCERRTASRSRSLTPDHP